MKEYKGWELIKALSEKKFNEGDIIKVKNSDDSYRITTNILGNYILTYKGTGDAAMIGTFTNQKRVFYKQVKTYNFLQAMDMISKGYKMTNDAITNKYFYYYNDNGIIKGSNERINFIPNEEIIADWYLWEE